MTLNAPVSVYLAWHRDLWLSMLSNCPDFASMLNTTGGELDWLLTAEVVAMGSFTALMDSSRCKHALVAGTLALRFQEHADKLCFGSHCPSLVVWAGAIVNTWAARLDSCGAFKSQIGEAQHFLSGSFSSVLMSKESLSQAESLASEDEQIACSTLQANSGSSCASLPVLTVTRRAKQYPYSRLSVTECCSQTKGHHHPLKSHTPS